MTLSATIAGNGVSVRIDSLKMADRVNQRSTCSFTVTDEAVTSFAQNQVVVIGDSVLGQQFVGFVEGIDLDRLTPKVTRFHTVTCKDHKWLAQKRLYTGEELAGQVAGDIVCKMHQDYLAAEGVTATYAMRHDYDSTTWGQGTLTGVSGASGGLELSPGGTVYTKKESTTTDFNSYTSMSYIGTGQDELKLTNAYAIKLQGTTVSTGSGDKYVYFKIWGGSTTVASGDYLEYNIWISSTSPAIKGGVDVVCSDGYTLRDSPALDQYQIEVHPDTDLKGYANDQWYYRKIVTPSQMVGKTLKYATVAFEAAEQGTYTMYVRTIRWLNSSGGVKATFFDGSINANQLLNNNGFHDVSMSRALIHDGEGYRESLGYSIASTGMVHSSTISWVSYEPQTSTDKPAVTIETSLDGGASWQECTNYGTIPCLLPGSLTSGKTVRIKQTLRVGGPNPELTPVIYENSITVLPGYSATKTDVSHYDTKGNMGDGTLSHVVNNADGVRLDGYYKDWDDADVSDSTIYGSNAAQSCYYRSFQMRCDTAADARARLDDCGQHTNFTCEVDVKVVDSGTNGYGLVYRTTYWDNVNNTYAYTAFITPSSVVLGKGSNSGTPSWTQIASVAHTFTVGNWYRLRVIASGTTHKVYVDDVEYINTTDSSYQSQGYIGLRYYNATGVRSSSFHDNFGLQDYSDGYRTAPSVSISAVGVVHNSYIAWDADVPSDTVLDIQASINGGTNYYSCTNGGVIPGCEAGQNVSGKSLLIKAVFTATNCNSTPLLKGVGWLVASSFSVSGTRVSPALSADSVGRAGSTSVSWIVETPPNTTCAVATSPDGSSWTTIASSGDPIAGVTSRGLLREETFAVNHSANFTSTFYSGGAVATYTWDTTNSKLQVSGGTNAVYSWDSYTGKDVEIDAILYQSNRGGLLARYTDAANHYRLMLYDDASTSGYQQKARLIKRSGGVDTVIQDNITIVFVRGAYHTVKWKIVGQVHTVEWDGVQVINYTDTGGISASGKTGFYNNGGEADWQTLFFRTEGDSMTGKSYYTRVTLASTDPTVSPRVTDLTLSVRANGIVTGQIVSDTDYAYKTKIDGILDDACKRSNAWYNIGMGKALTFQDRPDVLAPWPLYSADETFQYSPKPRLAWRTPLYRNKQWITNAIDVVEETESKKGTGVTSSWAVKYQIKSVQQILWNGIPQSFGLKGIDTNKTFYYTIGEQAFMLDTTVAVPPTSDETITISYRGAKRVNKSAVNQAQIDALKLVDNSTGIVEAFEDCNGLSGDAAQELADARIEQYAMLTRDWSFTTTRPGLEVGHMLYVYVPEFGLYDVAFFITEKNTTLKQKADGTISALYDIACTEGPSIGSWSRYFLYAA